MYAHRIWKRRVRSKGIFAGDKIELFDLVGNFILTETARSSSHSMDISSLAPGIYIIKVDNKKPEKIIKTNEN